jgi:hypothetical protein
MQPADGITVRQKSRTLFQRYQRIAEVETQLALKPQSLMTDTVEKVESLTSLQICQNTNDIFD